MSTVAIVQQILDGPWQHASAARQACRDQAWAASCVRLLRLGRPCLVAAITRVRRAGWERAYHAIYDALFRGDAVDETSDAPTEVACWSHVRRRFWEAAVPGFAVGRDGLLRIRHLYQLDQTGLTCRPLRDSKSAGRSSLRSSTNSSSGSVLRTISVAPPAAPWIDPDFEISWAVSAKAKSALSSALKRPGSREMGATGIICSNSAGLSERT
jgi:hypothetical protein